MDADRQSVVEVVVVVVVVVRRKSKSGPSDGLSVCLYDCLSALMAAVHAKEWWWSVFAQSSSSWCCWSLGEHGRHGHPSGSSRSCSCIRRAIVIIYTLTVCVLFVRLTDWVSEYVLLAHTHSTLMHIVCLSFAVALCVQFCFLYSPADQLAQLLLPTFFPPSLNHRVAYPQSRLIPPPPF